MIRFVKIAVGLGAVALLAYVLVEQRQMFVAALTMPVQDFVLISIFTLLDWFISSFMYVRMLRPLNVRFPFWQMVAVHVAAGLLNYLPFRIGTVYRARYFNKLAGLRYSYFASMFALNFLLMALSAGIVGFACIISGDFHKARSTILLAVFAAMALASAAVILLPLPPLRSSSRLAKTWSELIHARNQITQHKKLCALLLACYILTFACGAFRFIGGYNANGTIISYGDALILGSINVLSVILSFTPGGLGIQELLAGAVGNAVGIPIVTGVVVAAVVRAVIVFWYLALGLPALFWLQRLKPNLQLEGQVAPR